MDHYTKGTELYFSEEYEKACSEFTESLKEGETAVKLLARSKCFLATKAYEDAYNDAQAAIAKDPSLTASYVIKGESAFMIEEYETSLAAFSIALSVSPKEKQSFIKKWIRKCQSELADSVVPDSEEEPMTVAKADEAKPEGEEAPTPEAPLAPVAQLPNIQIYHNYYQSEEKVTINILGDGFKSLKRENLETKFTESHFWFRASMPGFQDYVWEFDFAEPIIESKSDVQYYPLKMEIVIVKAKKQTWPSLEKSSKIVRPPVADINRPKYPSPYAQKTDWDSLEKEELEEEKKEKEAGDGINSFFQMLYAKADPATRMAMNKSFQTSGGTVLSTNWGEVKDKDYENDIKPPDGMEYRKKL